MIAKSLGKELNYEMVDFHSQRPGHDLRYSLSGDKMLALGWEPPIDFTSSLKKTVDWYLKEELIENCASSPIIFAERMLGVKLYAWQVRFMNDLLVPVNSEFRNLEQKEFVAITSRQIGKSTLLAIFNIWCCIFNKVPATTYNNTTVGISSARIQL
jgi:hypothetical protein